MSLKVLIWLGFRKGAERGAIIDSPEPKHYGPRGFEAGRNDLNLLALARCPGHGLMQGPR